VQAIQYIPRNTLKMSQVRHKSRKSSVIYDPKERVLAIY
jgi:hypothetical protein